MSIGDEGITIEVINADLSSEYCRIRDAIRADLAAMIGSAFALRYDLISDTFEPCDYDGADLPHVVEG